MKNQEVIINARIASAKRSLVHRMAKRQKMSASQWVRDAIDEKLAREKRA